MSDGIDEDGAPRRKPRKVRERVPSSYRIEVIRRRCTAVGTCMQHASRTFDMDDSAVAVVVDPDGNTDAEVLEAAQSCPVDAIFLYDKVTGEKVWPPRDKRFGRGEGEG
jgi:ferredoxin